LPFSTEKPKQIYERTLGVVLIFAGPGEFRQHPIFMDRAGGSRLYDVDGNE